MVLVQCFAEQPFVLAASCASRSRENPTESGSAIVSPVSVGRAVSLRRWPASPHPTGSLAGQPNTFTSVTREAGSHSGSALSAGQPSSTPKRVRNSRPSPSPSERLPTRASPHPKTPFMTAAGIPGFNYRQEPPRTTRTPRRRDRQAQRIEPPSRRDRQAQKIEPPRRRGAKTRRDFLKCQKVRPGFEAVSQNPLQALAPRRLCGSEAQVLAPWRLGG
jgi:hypothetical protein